MQVGGDDLCGRELNLSVGADEEVLHRLAVVVKVEADGEASDILSGVEIHVAVGIEHQAFQVGAHSALKVNHGGTLQADVVGGGGGHFVGNHLCRSGQDA